MLLPIGISLYTVLDCCWLQFVRLHHALCSRPVRCSRVSLRPVSWCSVQDNRSRLQGNRLLSDPGTRLFWDGTVAPRDPTHAGEFVRGFSVRKYLTLSIKETPWLAHLQMTPRATPTLILVRCPRL